MNENVQTPTQEQNSRQYVEPKKKQPIWLYIVLLCLVTLIVAMRFISPVSNPQSIVVALDYTPNTNHTGLYVAKELGYYKEAGLDVDIVQPAEDGADAMVATGSAQFGVGYQDVMANYLGSQNPLPVSAVAAILQHNTSGILSPKAAQITSPSKMENHTYATWNIPVEQAIVKAVVEQDGGDFSKVKLVPYTTDDEVQALRSGDFDAVWVYEGWARQNAIRQNYEHNYFAFRDISPVFDYYTPVLISSNKYLEEHPDEAKRYIDATKRGYEYAALHPFEAAEILKKEVPLLDRNFVVQSQKYASSMYLDDEGDWGKIDPARWNNFYSWMNMNKLTEIALQDNAGLNTTFIN